MYAHARNQTQVKKHLKDDPRLELAGPWTNIAMVFENILINWSNLKRVYMIATVPPLIQEQLSRLRACSIRTSMRRKTGVSKLCWEEKRQACFNRSFNDSSNKFIYCVGFPWRFARCVMCAHKWCLGRNTSKGFIKRMCRFMLKNSSCAARLY